MRSGASDGLFASKRTERIDKKTVTFDKKFDIKLNHVFQLPSGFNLKRF